MADEDKTMVPSSETNNVDSGKAESPDESPPSQVQGWLRKRSKTTHKWKRKWFTINKTDLLYGDSEQSTRKRIALLSAEVCESGVDKKPYAFKLKPKDSKRTYYLMADDEDSRTKWMQAICYVRAGAAGPGDQSQACVIQ